MKKVLELEKDRKNVSEEKLNKYTKILSKMLNTKTVFTPDFRYQKEFDKFYEIIDENFPNIKSKAKHITFGSGCFLYLIEGKNAKRNVMLMSHHDVVEGSDTRSTNPFKSEIHGDKLIGRGAIDTKTSLFGELEAVEELLEEGYCFEGINLYIGSSNNEEVSGDGMIEVAKYFKDNNIHIDTILDEGGAIVSDMVPGYKGKSAMVAIHEKGRYAFECKVTLENKGHVSLSPSKESAILNLSRFIDEVSSTKIFKPHFYPEVKGIFKEHVPYMKFPFNFIFNNLGLFSPLIKSIMKKGAQTREMLTTSIKFTCINSGDKDKFYMAPKEASAIMYIRCLRDFDIKNNFYKIEKIAKKYGVAINLMNEDYCVPSTYQNEGYKILKETLNSNFPDVVVAPFLLTAGTDARRFSEVASNILRFAPIDLNKEQFASIHGDNEYIHLKTIGECVLFYKDFIKKYSRGI